ncbi:MAG: tRNA pseudouridine(38-40) synthase TruA [Clostridiales bacterium]|jgi:tRNA pseudouridine38-40 synthase|nr:tRNA pseudouridine(38-40) synthase TruA [Clostridiales bacterium]
MSGRALLTLSYDGTNYAGWQRQANAISVQQIVEEALSRLLGRAAKVVGGGRTDAGVHALGQRAMVIKPCPGDIIIPPDKLHLALNALLPSDVKALASRAVPDDFHPIRSAAAKTYVYTVYNGIVMPPVYRLYAAHERRPLDIEAIKAAAVHFIGTHDFIGFSSAGGSAATSVRVITALETEWDGALLRLTITGNGFLYNMARIIAGTLILAGLNKVRPEEFPSLIASRDRNHAGPTMPACGLMLKNIIY